MAAACSAMMGESATPIPLQMVAAKIWSSTVVICGNLLLVKPIKPAHLKWMG